MVVVVGSDQAEQVLARLRSHELGRDAALVGTLRSPQNDEVSVFTWPLPCPGAARNQSPAHRVQCEKRSTKSRYAPL